MNPALMTYLQGETELDGGPLSPLSEAYFATHPHGMYTLVHLQGDLAVPALREAVRRSQTDYPALAGVLTERKRGGRYELVRSPLERPPELEVHLHDQPVGEDDRCETIRKILHARHERPFDLFREAPARFLLFSFQEGRSCLVINTHHTCADGFVLRHLIGSILTHYHRLVTGEDRLSTPPGRNGGDSHHRPLSYRANAKGLAHDLYLRRTQPMVKNRPSRDAGNDIQPFFSSLALSAEETTHVTLTAKRLQITVNDWLNVAMIRTIDEIRGHPNGLMSVCLPVDLRRFLRTPGRHANLTSGFYINLRRRERTDAETLLQTFAAQRARLLKDRRALFNLLLLQKMFRLLRRFPHAGRAAWLSRWGYYPTTFFCSNLGVVELPTRGLRVTGGDILVYPNRSADYSIVAMTYNGVLKMAISTDRRVVPAKESELFRERLKRHLVHEQENLSK